MVLDNMNIFTGRKLLYKAVGEMGCLPTFTFLDLSSPLGSVAVDNNTVNI